MRFPKSSLSSPPHPAGRNSAFSQKVASKVFFLIEKFESLTKPHPLDQKPPPPPSPPHLSFTAARTSFRRLSTSVLKRASLFTEQRVGPQPENMQPPKRRFLKISRDRVKHQIAAKMSDWDERIRSRHSSNGFDCDGPTSTINSNSTLVDTDTSASTPPVAQILPSSFFDQLLSSNRHTIKNKFKSRKGLGRKRKFSPRSVQDLRGNVVPKEYGFISIKRKLSGEKKNAKVLEGVERTFKILTPEELNSRRNQESSGSLPHGNPSLREADSGEVEDSAEQFHDDDWFYTDSFYDASNEGFSSSSSSFLALPSCSQLTIACDFRDSYTPDSIQLMCRDRRFLTTDVKYMPDGTLSNFGYLMHRLESESGTPYPKSETKILNENILTQVDASTRRMKVYRKTPPPPGFFNSKNRRISSGSSMVNFGDEEFPEIPEIISPVPLNAVQEAELRGMVFRYT